MFYRTLSAEATRALLTGALGSLFVVAGVGNAVAATVQVTTSLDAGPGSFRAAVEAANADSSIDEIEFAARLAVDLETEVVYTGEQDLAIDGEGSTVSGALGDAAANTTWDGGLFVSTSAANLNLANISFVDSFNNGVAVFLPEGGGTTKVRLGNVEISGSQFHGLLIDG